MPPTLVILHLVASGVALLSGGLVLGLMRRVLGSVLAWSGLLYVGSVGVMGASSMGLFRETGGWHALHGVALLLIVIVSPAGWAMVRSPGDPTPCLRHRRALSGTYLVLLVSTVLETARRLVAPILAARGFEAWETYWIAVGLLTASVALIGLRLVRNRILDPTVELGPCRGAEPRGEGAAEK
ncbi:MAG: hypothetical protein RLZ45_707 [Verrucomicrobiota bacterium]|jgi:hypothetical protein